MLRIESKFLFFSLPNSISILFNKRLIQAQEGIAPSRSDPIISRAKPNHYFNLIPGISKER